MGWRDLFKSKSGGEDGASAGRPGRVHAPSPDYSTPLDAIRALLLAHGLPTVADAGDDVGWLTFEARAGGKSGIVEVAGDRLNFCTESLDLPTVLRTLGLEALAAAARPGAGDDRTLWHVAGADADAVARVIDATFAAVLGGGGLGDSYEVWGTRQD